MMNGFLPTQTLFNKYNISDMNLERQIAYSTKNASQRVIFKRADSQLLSCIYKFEGQNMLPGGGGGSPPPPPIFTVLRCADVYVNVNFALYISIYSGMESNPKSMVNMTRKTYIPVLCYAFPSFPRTFS